jgi:predicted aspartyl protease
MCTDFTGGTMGLIYKQVTLFGQKGSSILSALFDSGASESFIRSDAAHKIARPMKMAHPWKLELAEGESKAEEVIVAQIDLNGYRLHGTFILIPKLTEELILGADFFQRWKIKLDPETEDIIIDPKSLKIKLV